MLVMGVIVAMIISKHEQQFDVNINHEKSRWQSLNEEQQLKTNEHICFFWEFEHFPLKINEYIGVPMFEGTVPQISEKKCFNSSCYNVL